MHSIVYNAKRIFYTKKDYALALALKDSINFGKDLVDLVINNVELVLHITLAPVAISD